MSCFTRCLQSQGEFTLWKAGIQEASSSWSCHLDKNTGHWVLVGFPSLCIEILDWGAYSSTSVINLFFSGPLQHGFLQVLFGYYICCLVDAADGLDSFLDHVAFIWVAQGTSAYASGTDSWMTERVYISLSSLSHIQHLSSPAYHTAATNSRQKSFLLTFPLLATWADFLQPPTWSHGQYLSHLNALVRSVFQSLGHCFFYGMTCRRFLVLWEGLSMTLLNIK